MRRLERSSRFGSLIKLGCSCPLAVESRDEGKAQGGYFRAPRGAEARPTITRRQAYLSDVLPIICHLPSDTSATKSVRLKHIRLKYQPKCILLMKYLLIYPCNKDMPLREDDATHQNINGLIIFVLFPVYYLSYGTRDAISIGGFKRRGRGGSDVPQDRQTDIVELGRGCTGPWKRHNVTTGTRDVLSIGGYKWRGRGGSDVPQDRQTDIVELGRGCTGPWKRHNATTGLKDALSIGGYKWRGRGGSDFPQDRQTDIVELGRGCTGPWKRHNATTGTRDALSIGGYKWRGCGGSDFPQDRQTDIVELGRGCTGPWKKHNATTGTRDALSIGGYKRRGRGGSDVPQDRQTDIANHLS
ncbi:hypothetical protein J6590_022901 [Homalodisca vitripennis]|nr:hypothetical protein J6590_022901 [Homalodisca vitripennis]